MRVQGWKPWVALLATGWSLAATGTAMAAQMVTVTATGTVTSSSESAGLTGDPAVSLIGRPVTLIHTLESPSGEFTSPGFSLASFQVVSVSVTIGSFSASIDGSAVPLLGGTYSVTRLDPGASLPAQVESLISDVDGLFFSSIHVSSDSSDFTVDSSLNRSHSFTAPPLGGAWRFGGALFDAQGAPLWDFSVDAADVTSIAFEPRGPSIPEPGTLAAASAALLVLSRIRRRARAAATVAIA